MPTFDRSHRIESRIIRRDADSIIPLIRSGWKLPSGWFLGHVGFRLYVHLPRSFERTTSGQYLGFQEHNRSQRTMVAAALSDKNSRPEQWLVRPGCRAMTIACFVRERPLQVYAGLSVGIWGHRNLLLLCISSGHHLARYEDRLASISYGPCVRSTSEHSDSTDRVVLRY